MKRMLISALGLLMASQLFAGVPGQRTLPPGEAVQLQRELGIKPRGEGKEVQAPLLFEVPGGTQPGRHRIEATFLVGGSPYFRERLSFDLTAGDTHPSVELLVWHPEQREKILELAKKPGNDVRIAIRLDGQGAQNFTLDRFLNQSRVLLENGSAPIVSQVEKPEGAAPLPFLTKNQQECRDNCLSNYYACSDACWDYACIQECQYWYNECYYYGCPPDCQPTTRTYTRRIVLQQSPVSQACIEDYRNPFSGGKVYTEFYTYERIETHEETRNCDGTTTDVVTSYFYTQYYCWAITGGSCGPYYSFNPAMRICY